MTPEEAISRLSNALALIATPNYSKETIRTLVEGLLDGKHKEFVERGFQENDRHLIMHGIMGALSHYEAEKETGEHHE